MLKIDWAKAVLTSTLNLRFEQEYKTYQTFLFIFFLFGLKIFKIFEKACFRNGRLKTVLFKKKKKKDKKKVQELSQSQNAALLRLQEKEETNKTKQALIEQTYEKN